MYRVVKDRERWFNVVMGEGLVPDDYAADKAAARVPLPESLGTSLSMDFSVAESLFESESALRETPKGGS